MINYKAWSYQKKKQKKPPQEKKLQDKEATTRHGVKEKEAQKD